MFKDYIKQQDGVELYSIVSLLIFVGFFTAVALYAMLRRKSLMQELSNIPLEGSASQSTEAINQTTEA